MAQPTPKSPASDNDIAALFLRLATVMRVTGLGRSTIYRLVADDQFPTPVQLTKRIIAWRRSDVEQWSAERPPVVH